MNTSPYLTAAEAAERLRKPTVNAFRSFKSRHNKRVPPRERLKAYRIGGRLLFKVTDIDRLVKVDDAAPVCARRSA